MKRLFILIMTAAVFAVSCHKYAVDSPITPVAGPTVGITVLPSSVNDSTFTVVFTPKVENNDISYYSYLVYESDVPDKLDSTTLYQCGYKGIASGTVEYAEGAKTYKLTLTAADGISPNTVYQIAAVAGSKMGVPGTITTDDVLTSDSLNPQPVGTPTSDTELGCITIKFSKDIHLTGENGAGAYAIYKRVWDPHEAESDSLVIPVDSIVVEGNEMTLFAPVKLPGAYVFFTWDKGIVKSDVDSSCAEYHTVIFEATAGIATEASPYCFRFPAESFGWARMCWSEEEQAYVEAPEDSVIAFVNPETSSYFLQPDTEIYTIESLEDIAVKYKNSKKTSAFATCDFDFVGDTLLALYFNDGEDPDCGDKVNYSIAEDSFEDVWGNYNEAYENENNFLRSYGYTVGDFCGTFALVQQSYQTSWAEYVDTITIDQLKGDSVILSGFGKYNPYFGSSFTPSPTPIKGIVDTVLGLLTISSEEVIGTVGEDDVIMASVFDDDDNPLYLQFQMPQKGEYNVPEEYIYFYFGSYWDAAYFIQMTPPSPSNSYTMTKIQSAPGTMNIPYKDRILKHSRK